MNRFSPRRFRLSPQRRALLEDSLQYDGLPAPALLPISLRPPHASPPLSFAQQHFWTELDAIMAELDEAEENL